tara:strand:- start:19458 stop:20261 length:804 start_codon:yes stop_codon:yes gene_type:complete
MAQNTKTVDNTATSLSIATYNVRKAIGRDYRRDPKRILESVSNLDVDIVALQEADYRFKQRQPIFTSEQVRHVTSMHTVALDHSQNGLGWHGNILLVNPKIRIVHARTIELPGLEPRGGLLVDLAYDGREIRIVSAHLGIFAAYRRRQVEVLMEAADIESGRTTFVLGDFNCWGKSRWSLKPFRDCLHEAACGKTFPAGNPVASLDRIFYTDHAQLKSCGPVLNGLTRIASDHLPVRAQFAIATARNEAEEHAVVEKPNAAVSGIGL